MSEKSAIRRCAFKDLKLAERKLTTSSRNAQFWLLRCISFLWRNECPVKERRTALTPQPNLSSELQQCRESVPMECELFLRPEIQSSVPRRMTIATLK